MESLLSSSSKKIPTSKVGDELLHYHLVLVVKYRRQVFDDTVSGRAKEIFEYIAPNYNITLEEWNHDKDYVHILFRAHQNTEISKYNGKENSMQGDHPGILFFNQIKQQSGLRISAFSILQNFL